MMRINKFAAAALLGISALGLSACATGLRTEVSRYQAMPAPQGQSFFVVPANPADTGGLEFARYAGHVAQAMQAQGYAQAPIRQAATHGRQRRLRRRRRPAAGRARPVRAAMATIPSGAATALTAAFGGFYGRPYYSRFGYWGPRSPFYYGWNDPFWYRLDGGYDQIRVYTVYKSFLDLDIRRKADNASLFEGHAQARSADDNLGVLVPNLIEAMFTGFPGQQRRNDQDHRPAGEAELDTGCD